MLFRIRLALLIVYSAAATALWLMHTADGTLPYKSNKRSWSNALLSIALAALLLALPPVTSAYSVLSHEAIIDAVWDTHLKPVLLARFPDATPDELRAAHAYAYGGAIIQDLGYYPHGSHFFSDLTHYVRSGDFIVALLRDSNSLDEYAFALGALAHYAADIDGHRIGTNRAVPLLYPKLAKKYGDSVSYEDDPLAHVKTEFGFDVLEVAKQRYAPQSYHDFVGFAVAEPLLNRAFEETYGLPLKSVLEDEDKVLGSYRRDVSKLIPKATRVAWSLKKDEIQRDIPGITKRHFLYNLKRSSYEKEWGKDYKGPSLGERILAFLYRLLPKVGPLKILQLRTPTPETELLFQSSFNATLHQYRSLLTQQRNGALSLPNENFDLGETSSPGQYRMNDNVHAKLLERLAERQFVGVSPALRENLLHFYEDPSAPYATRKNHKAWARLQSELQQLQSSAPGVSVSVPPGK